MNNLITLNNETLTMSSREIAELCEKEHRNVCRDIEKLNLEYEKLGLLKIEQGYYTHPNTGNQQHREFLLSREQSIDLITGYRADVRIKVNRRWQELESQQKQTDPMELLSDPRSMRNLLLGYSEKVIKLEEKVEEMAPTVKAYDRLVTESQGSMCPTDAAKHLGIKPKHLFDFLSSNKWIYKRPGNSNWIAYQDKLQALLLEHKIHIAKREDNTDKVCERVLITAKGLAKLAKILNLPQHTLLA